MSGQFHCEISRSGFFLRLANRITHVVGGLDPAGIPLSFCQRSQRFYVDAPVCRNFLNLYVWRSISSFLTLFILFPQPIHAHKNFFWKHPPRTRFSLHWSSSLVSILKTRTTFFPHFFLQKGPNLDPAHFFLSEFCSLKSSPSCILLPSYPRPPFI